MPGKRLAIVLSSASSAAFDRFIADRNAVLKSAEGSVGHPQSQAFRDRLRATSDPKRLLDALAMLLSQYASQVTVQEDLTGLPKGSFDFVAILDWKSIEPQWVTLDRLVQPNISVREQASLLILDASLTLRWFGASGEASATRYSEGERAPSVDERCEAASAERASCVYLGRLAFGFESIWQTSKFDGALSKLSFVLQL